MSIDRRVSGVPGMENKEPSEEIIKKQLEDTLAYLNANKPSSSPAFNAKYEELRKKYAPQEIHSALVDIDPKNQLVDEKVKEAFTKLGIGGEAEALRYCTMMEAQKQKFKTDIQSMRAEAAKFLRPVVKNFKFVKTNLDEIVDGLRKINKKDFSITEKNYFNQSHPVSLEDESGVAKCLLLLGVAEESNNAELARLYINKRIEVSKPAENKFDRNTVGGKQDDKSRQDKLKNEKDRLKKDYQDISRAIKNAGKDEVLLVTELDKFKGFIKKHVPLPEDVSQSDCVKWVSSVLGSPIAKTQEVEMVGLLRVDFLDRLFSAKIKKNNPIDELIPRIFDGNVPKSIRKVFYEFVVKHLENKDEDNGFYKNVFSKISNKIDHEWRGIEKRFKEKKLTRLDDAQIAFIFMTDLPRAVTQETLFDIYLLDPDAKKIIAVPYQDKLNPAAIAGGAKHVLSRLLSRPAEDVEKNIIPKLEAVKASPQLVESIIEDELWKSLVKFIQKESADESYSQSLLNIKRLFLKMDGNLKKLEAGEKNEGDIRQDVGLTRKEFLEGLINVLRYDYRDGHGKLMRSFFESGDYNHRIQFIEALKEIRDNDQLAHQAEFLAENRLLYQFIDSGYSVTQPPAPPEQKVSASVTQSDKLSKKELQAKVGTLLESNGFQEIRKLLCQDKPPLYPYRADVLSQLLSSRVRAESSSGIFSRLRSSPASNGNDDLLLRILSSDFPGEDLRRTKMAIYNYMLDAAPNSQVLKDRWETFVEECRMMGQNMDSPLHSQVIMEADPIAVVLKRNNLDWVKKEDFRNIYAVYPDMFYKNPEYAKALIAKFTDDAETANVGRQLLEGVELIKLVRSSVETANAYNSSQRTMVKNLLDEVLQRPSLSNEEVSSLAELKENEPEETIARVFQEDEKYPMDERDRATSESELGFDEEEFDEAAELLPPSSNETDRVTMPSFVDVTKAHLKNILKIRGVEDWPKVLVSPITLVTGLIESSAKWAAAYFRNQISQAELSAKYKLEAPSKSYGARFASQALQTIGNIATYTRNIVGGAADLFVAATAKIADLGRSKENRTYGKKYPTFRDAGAQIFSNVASFIDGFGIPAFNKPITAAAVSVSEAATSVSQTIKTKWKKRKDKAKARAKTKKPESTTAAILNGFHSSENSEQKPESQKAGKKTVRWLDIEEKETNNMPAKDEKALADEKMIAATKLLKTPGGAEQNPEVIVDGVEAYLQRILTQLKEKHALNHEGVFGDHHSQRRNSLSSNASSDANEIAPKKSRT